MAYSGWRFSCDRSVLERCAGALKIEANNQADKAVKYEKDGTAYNENAEECSLAVSLFYIFYGAQVALDVILSESDSLDPNVFVERVRKLSETD